MMDPLADLNGKQREVVLATSGPVLVLAGAGSGKTRALTHRIAYLMQKGLAKPEEIFAVTFTNKAAREMKERIIKLVGPGKLPAAIGTFHGLGARILREQHRYLPRSAGFTIYDAQDSERAVKAAMDEAGISKREVSARSIKTKISRAKNELRRPQDEAADRVYERYQKLLAEQDAFDFDDLLIMPLLLLEQKENIRRYYQEKWRYLSVDEYQDTNPPQARLLELLCNAEENLCAVGDDYQAIYSWRGARVDHILNFAQRWPKCTTIYLTENYRSTPQVLEAAHSVIAENSAQMHKELWTRQVPGRAVVVAQLPSDRREAAWVRQQIQEHEREGGRLADCVVLYRTNAQSRLFEEEFLTHSLPYNIVGGYRFYERKEIKDALALLQLWQNENSFLSLQRLAQVLWRGIGPKTVESWKMAARSSGQGLLPSAARASRHSGVQKLAQTFQQAKGGTFQNVSELLNFLLLKSGYTMWLKTQADGEERRENLEELLNVTASYQDTADFLEEVALLTDIDRLDTKADRVTCMTLHAAKGLEFPVVFVTGCEEGLLPHQNSRQETASLEEERRLLYVGMTRAKQRLTLTYAAQRLHRGQFMPAAPSRFLKALPANVEQTEDWVSESSETILDYALPEFN